MANQREITRLSMALRASEALKRGYFDEVERLRLENKHLVTALRDIVSDVSWAEQIAKDAISGILGVPQGDEHTDQSCHAARADRRRRHGIGLDMPAHCAVFLED
jgi:hypothetical protein